MTTTTPDRCGRRSLAALLTAALLAAPLAAQQPDPAWADFDAYVAAAVGDWQVPGLAVAVVLGSELDFAQGYDARWADAAAADD